jgi:hypothetical protein
LRHHADLKLTAVRGAKITGSAVPGEVLEIQASVAGRMGPLIQVQGEIRCAGRQLLTAQITLSGTPGTALA